jgi:hypothetical protein
VNRLASGAAVTCALVLMGLGWFGADQLGLSGPPELGDASLPEGAEVILTLATVVSVEGDRALLEKTPDVYVVVGRHDWEAGEDWTVGGTWSGGEIHAVWATEHPDRGGKKGLGVLGLVLTFAALPLGVRGRPGELVLRG